MKHIQSGLNPSSINELQFNGAHTAEVVKIGLVVAVIALTVYILIPNQNSDFLIGLMILNIIILLH